MKIKNLKLGQYLHGYIGSYEAVFQVVSAPFQKGKWIKLLIQYTDHPKWGIGEVIDESDFGMSYTKLAKPVMVMGEKCTDEHASYMVGDVVTIKMPEYGRVYALVQRIGTVVEMITIKSRHPNFPIGSTIKEDNLLGYRFIAELNWEDA